MQDSVLDAVLEAPRLGIADRMLEQVLSGDGVLNNPNGVASATGIGTGSYVMSDRGSDEAFTDAEIAVADAGGRTQYMAWALGVCPRIRSWRRKPPRNNLLTVIWTLSWSN